jgi:hypothetical protein
VKIFKNAVAVVQMIFRHFSVQFPYLLLHASINRLKQLHKYNDVNANKHCILQPLSTVRVVSAPVYSQWQTMSANEKTRTAECSAAAAAAATTTTFAGWQASTRPTVEFVDRCRSESTDVETKNDAAATVVGHQRPQRLDCHSESVRWSLRIGRKQI